MDSKVEENYKRLREELNERLNNDKRLTEIMDKISKGTATFKDSAEYSQIVADHMGDVISKNIGNIKIPMGKEMVCKELLKENIERVDTVFGKVQVSVDEKMGIHLNPVTPPYPTERVNAIAHSLEDPNADDEKVARRGKSSGNVVAARHDENVKANAAWREKAGFDCYLVRDAGGGCCPWCAAIAGRYKYADAPDDVFRRHDHCTCTLTYECGKMRQDVWSKRTWEASPEELQARKDAAEAAKPTVNTPEQAKELEKQILEKNPVTKLTPEQAKAIDEQSKPVVNTPEQAKELEDKILGNVNKNEVEKQDESGIIENKESAPAVEYKQLTLDEFKSMKGKITKEQRKILYGHDIKTAYINSSEAKYINADLRNGVELTGKRKEIADTLSEVINNNTIPENIQVFRYVDRDALSAITGVDFPMPKLTEPAEEYWARLNKLPELIGTNKEFVEKGFMSTSAVAEKNVFKERQLVLNINVPKETHGYITTNNKESEIIFDHGTKLLIKECRIEDSGTSKFKVILECEILR